MALHRSSVLGLGHGLWNYQTQSNNPEVIPKQFLAVGTCFMFVEPFTIGTALSLIDFCILTTSPTLHRKTRSVASNGYSINIICL